MLEYNFTKEEQWEDPVCRCLQVWVCVCVYSRYISILNLFITNFPQLLVLFLRPQTNKIGDRPFGCTIQGRAGIFLTRSMQTYSSVVVETIPWPSIMIVAIMNGISAANFTMIMNATKFHITMPQKQASATLHSVALPAIQYFSCASIPCKVLQFPRDRVAQ